MNSTCYFCHLNLGWHSAAVRCAQQTPASLMLQAHRPLSWAITDTTLPAAKWKPGVLANVTESFQKQISPMRNCLVIVVLVLGGFFFSLCLFCFFFSSLVSKGRHWASLWRAAGADSQAEQPSSAQHLWGQWGLQHRWRAEAHFHDFLYPFHPFLPSLAVWT